MMMMGFPHDGHTSGQMVVIKIRHTETMPKNQLTSDVGLNPVLNRFHTKKGFYVNKKIQKIFMYYYFIK